MDNFLQKKKKYFFTFLCFFAIFFPSVVSVNALEPGETPLAETSLEVVKNAHVDTSNTSFISKIAPGEYLPVSTKLLNFGGGKNVDVNLRYEILNTNGEILYENSETVAVETTASFIKRIQIPFDAESGKYVVRTSVIYLDQIVPANSDFTFLVEEKIFGLYKGQFLNYAFSTLAFGLFIGIVGYFLMKRHRRGRFDYIDYSDIPDDRQVFYELISDTILEMRERVGDVALEIASRIDGLVIDKKTGRVENVSKNPATIVASLVSGYEKALGKKVSFIFRRKK